MCIRDRYVGVAVGATAVLVPEHPYYFRSQVAEKIRHARLNGKTNFRIVVAEGAASAVEAVSYTQLEMGFLPVENPRPDLGLSHTIALGMAHRQDMDGVMFQVRCV